MVADIGIISRLFLMYFCRKVRVVVQFKQWCRNVGSVKEKLRLANYRMELSPNYMRPGVSVTRRLQRALNMQSNKVIITV